MSAMEDGILVTGIRVVDLFSPVKVGGVLAIGGDDGAGVNVVSMEVTQNLCRRYGATAALLVTSQDPFNESNVRSWVERLKIGDCVSEITAGDRPEIVITSARARVATLLPFADSGVDADAMVTLRRSVLESGRLPAVEVSESWSKLAEDGAGSLPARARASLHGGNRDLEEYLAQPFFVAEPWTSKPGEVTEREKMIAEVASLVR